MTQIAVHKITLPPSEFKRAIRLLGFDYGDDFFHMLGFEVPGHADAIGIWREGDNFCARISLNALADFWYSVKEDYAPKPRPYLSSALSAITELMKVEPAKDSTEGRFLDALVTAVEAYEKVTFPIDGAAPTPTQEQAP